MTGDFKQLRLIILVIYLLYDVNQNAIASWESPTNPGYSNDLHNPTGGPLLVCDDSNREWCQLNQVFVTQLILPPPPPPQKKKIVPWAAVHQSVGRRWAQRMVNGY